jgi:hypothetical protein
MTEIINGLLSQKPDSKAPEPGEERWFTWAEMTSKKGKPWIKIKNSSQEYGGQLCQIVDCQKTNFLDAHGNVSFNIGFERVFRSDGGGTQQAQRAIEAAASREDTPPSAEPSTQGKTEVVHNGLNETRQHLMQVANLYSLCVKAVDAAIAPNVPEMLKTSEWLQAAVASLFIEASHRRTNDGVHWWSYCDKMPARPIKNVDPPEARFHEEIRNKNEAWITDKE